MQKQTNFAQPAPVSNQFDQPASNMGNSNSNSTNPSSTDDIISLIEKIAKLHQAGALTDDEFNSKKIELLSRI